MRECLTFYINGDWVAPARMKTLDIENPANEQVIGRVALGTAADVDKAVAAARAAFEAWSQTSCQERLELLETILIEYDKRADDLAMAVTEEMGAPLSLAKSTQVPIGRGHIATAREVLRDFKFEELRSPTLIVKEPIGVCGFITPWNWPLNQITCKVAPAIAAGCTMVLKPSEVAPVSGQIFAEVMDAARVPAGVFNLIQGDGAGVGMPMSCHPGIDMVSFTGSTRAGIEVAKKAAPSVKRVHQELGGKSPNLVMDDDLFAENVARSVRQMMTNSGQSCNAPSRMLIPRKRMSEAVAIAKEIAERIVVGDPLSNVNMGPVISRAQWERIQNLIRRGIDEGATLITGGIGRPDGLTRGYFLRPTIFTNVTNDMTIAREEIFGPVLAILGYDTLDQAISIGNDTRYGLAAYVQGADLSLARAIASKLRAGQVSINGGTDRTAPFGGYKMSGNGREWGDHAFHEFLETKAILGYEERRT